MNGKVWRKKVKRNGQTIVCGKWYGTLKTFDGQRKQIPLTEDKRTAETLLQRLQRDEDGKRAAGVTRQDVQRSLPLSVHLDAYRTYLSAKGNTAEYVDTSMRRIANVFAATKTKAIDEIDGQRILSTLDGWRRRKRKPISAGTVNHYLTCVKAFTRWLWRERITLDDPLAGLRKLNAETDRRRVRRPLTPAELDTLTTATQKSKKSYMGNDWRFTPTDRAMLYLIAAFTGLRASECAALRKSSFDFEAMTLTMEASASKNRKRTVLPLSSTLAVKLRAWFDTLDREALFPGSWAVKRMGGKMLQRDLKRCGIAYQDDSGRYADFHALRHTFITSLARAGVHPSKAQRLARHSTISLTMDVYTTLNVDDLRDAIDSI